MMMCVMLRDPPLHFGIVFDMLLFVNPFPLIVRLWDKAPSHYLECSEEKHISDLP